jgi:hypothetical protein
MTCSIPVLVLLTLGIFAGIVALGYAFFYFLEHASEKVINIFFTVVVFGLLLMLAFLLAGKLCGVTP